MSRLPFRGRLKAAAVVLLRLLSSPSTRKDEFRPSCDEPAFSNPPLRPRRAPEHCCRADARIRLRPTAVHAGGTILPGFPVGGWPSGMGQSLLNSFQPRNSNFEGCYRSHVPMDLLQWIPSSIGASNHAYITKPYHDKCPKLKDLFTSPQNIK